MQAMRGYNCGANVVIAVYSFVTLSVSQLQIFQLVNTFETQHQSNIPSFYPIVSDGVNCRVAQYHCDLIQRDFLINERVGLPSGTFRSTHPLP